MKKYNLFISILLTLFYTTACQNKSKETESETMPEKKGIEITVEQFAKAKMELGSPKAHVFSELVTTKGFLKASAAGKANVSVFLPGRVKEIMFVMGDFVKKGTTLFVLEGNEIIELQQSFAQNKAELDLAKYELDRMEKLVNEKIAATKDLNAAQSQFQTLKATHEGLKARLKLLNIDPAKVEIGEINPEVSILAPISAYITQLNIVQGEYLESQKIAIELIDTRNLQLYLSVFETDIFTLAKGQKVLFYDSDRKDRRFEATLSLVGKSIDPQSKTIQCIANLNDKTDHNFVNGMYVECAIVTSEHESNAIPTEAIIKDGYNHYVLVKESGKDGILNFAKVNIEIGKEELEFTEVLTEGLEDVLLAGVYNLNVEE
ncbi:MAG: efflux RND transporter periplasmic adaptor subunit [Prolixibacteraceae bacterium]|jgi:cobalt-zinc-cadmium efflux system membrane fusion protein|nr:efflux RND transporter periplasmic adaptor subunit [Prolixibacteraceae bacterium]